MEIQTATPASGRLTAPPGELKLRIVGGSRDGQLLRLRATKCSVGSDRRCTLRLRARGVRPIHCLIVRGRQATIVRRWSMDTRLNGSSFSDAKLVAGDRLSIGPIELEVVDDAPSADQSETTREQVARLLETERSSLQERQAEWEEVRRCAEERLGNRTQEMVEKLADLKAEQKSLAAQKKQVETERATLQAEREKQRKLIVDHQQQREQEARQAIRKEQQEWEAERRRREDRLRLRAKQIKQRQENADAELNAPA